MYRDLGYSESLGPFFFTFHQNIKMYIQLTNFLVEHLHLALLRKMKSSKHMGEHLPPHFKYPASTFMMVYEN